MTDQPGGAASRRSFLAGLAAAATMIALDPFRFVATNGAVYENLRLGLTAELPTGWEFSSIADFVSLRAHQVLLDQIASEHHALKNPEELPVFIFEEPAHRDGHFAPGIVFYDNPIGHPPADEPSAHLGLLRRFARSYRDLQISQEPAPTTLGRTPATLSKWSYFHETDGDGRELSVRTVLVFRGDRANTFHLVDDHESPCIEDRTWAEFLESIQYK